MNHDASRLSLSHQQSRARHGARRCRGTAGLSKRGAVSVSKWQGLACEFAEGESARDKEECQDMANGNRIGSATETTAALARLLALSAAYALPPVERRKEQVKRARARWAEKNQEKVRGYKRKWFRRYWERKKGAGG